MIKNVVKTLELLGDRLEVCVSVYREKRDATNQPCLWDVSKRPRQQHPAALHRPLSLPDASPIFKSPIFHHFKE